MINDDILDIKRFKRSNDIEIKVIGLGGSGGNAVDFMYKTGIEGVEFYVCNTDKQDLDSSSVPNRVQIGKELTKGLGAGGDPEIGKKAAEESKDVIEEILKQNGTKMVLIAAGMGGGTGTGAAPVTAEIAKKLGILTIGIVTYPFNFEGTPRKKRAKEGIEELRKYCDSVVLIYNDKLPEIYGKDLKMDEAYDTADRVLFDSAKSITEIICVPGKVNIDFSDVCGVLKDSGNAVIGKAIAKGENRIIKAAEKAISSPLLNNASIKGANKVLVNLIVSNLGEFSMDEYRKLGEFLKEKVENPDVELIIGNTVDENLGDSIAVSIIVSNIHSDKTLPTQSNNSKKRNSSNKPDISTSNGHHHRSISDIKTNNILSFKDNEIKRNQETPAYFRYKNSKS